MMDLVKDTGVNGKLINKSYVRPFNVIFDR
jgi:hypothetical protein